MSAGGEMFSKPITSNNMLKEEDSVAGGENGKAGKSKFLASRKPSLKFV